MLQTELRLKIVTNWPRNGPRTGGGQIRILAPRPPSEHIITRITLLPMACLDYHRAMMVLEHHRGSFHLCRLMPLLSHDAS